MKIKVFHSINRVFHRLLEKKSILKQKKIKKTSFCVILLITQKFTFKWSEYSYVRQIFVNKM